MAGRSGLLSVFISTGLASSSAVLPARISSACSALYALITCSISAGAGEVVALPPATDKPLTPVPSASLAMLCGPSGATGASRLV